MHEDLARAEEVRGSSDRSFGIVFTAVFAVVAFWPLLRGGTPRTWALGVASAFLLLALLKPGVLAPLNRVWFRFGLLLHRIVSPLVLGAMFYLVFTPFGLVMRLAGRRPLALELERDAESYWITRDPAGPAPESMIKQF